MSPIAGNPVDACMHAWMETTEQAACVKHVKRELSLSNSTAVFVFIFLTQ